MYDGTASDKYSSEFTVIKKDTVSIVATDFTEGLNGVLGASDAVFVGLDDTGEGEPVLIDSFSLA